MTKTKHQAAAPVTSSNTTSKISRIVKEPHKVEPVLTAATISGIIVAVAAACNVVLETGTIETILAAVLPIVLGLFARAKVTPTAS
jgi:predicted nucleic acid-binding protein